MHDTQWWNSASKSAQLNYLFDNRPLENKVIKDTPPCIIKSHNACVDYVGSHYSSSSSYAFLDKCTV
jgi:hypothetical protein